MHPSQYGFRKYHSTQYAIFHSIIIIQDNLKANNPSIAIFVDIQKAFDSINH